MDLTSNALTVLKARYLSRDKNGKITESPEQMLRRVARAIASSELLYGGDPGEWEEKFYDAMSSLLFLPNTPALINAGKDQGQLAACFVLPIEDSMKGIFGSLTHAALIMQSGGGTGFSFSKLRPRADIVKSTGGISSGPVSFMKIYSTATEVIKQGGTRRGANMGILRIDHPDIIEFIRMKQHSDEFSNFNISIAMTDSFMKALKKGAGYSLQNPRSKKRAGRLNAKEVFNEIVESAWKTGDPGLLFIDRINRDNPTPLLGRIESTNPCGEQPLLPFEACVLGSINLSKFVKSEARELGITKKTSGLIDWGLLSYITRLSVRFLDNTIDANKYPLDEIERMHKSNRKIGVGVMGWADMLIKLGIRYNSPKALKLAGKIMRFIRDHARDASCELARERGPFPNFSGSIYDKPEFNSKGGIRNATLTTIAPTGTLSVIAGCSSGIEPLFGVAYKRHVLETELDEIHPYFVKKTRHMGCYSPELIEKIAQKGSLRGFGEIPPDLKRLFVTAHEISPEDHVEVQAAFQKFTDNAVSKTVNLKPRATRDDVARTFLLAYEKGCKGITVFRYNSKRGTLIRPDGID
jgi:ribonucleoside-diphosphate reductase alpha chain